MKNLMIKLYEAGLSGNCHKVRLILSILGVKYDQISVGQHKSPEFLKLNPLGLIPVLVDDEVIIRDSQAILVYLTRKYENENWLPLEPESMAKVMQWLSFAANEIGNSLSVARGHFLFNRNVNWEDAQVKGKQVLRVMNEHLQQNEWLELKRPTIADIACFPYVGLAPQGKVSLDGYPHVLTWIERIKQLPGYVSMPGL